MPRLATICVFGLLVPTAASAETRFKRDPQVPQPIELSERVRPPQAVKAPATLPTVSVDVVLSASGLTGAIRTEQEQILADLINNTPDSEREEKSDYYFRLGELYAKQMLFWQRKGQELFVAKNDREARIAADKAKGYLLKAVKTYKGLTDNDAFRDYPKLDMALFFYGYTLQAGKYMKEARSVYDKLLKTFPNSKYVPEAHLAFAEYYFEAGQLADAEARYKQVLKFPKSSAYYYALYKLAAIDTQLNRGNEAIERLMLVAQGTANDKKLAPIFDAAKAAITRSATTVTPEKALAMLGKTRTPEMVEALATQYFEQGSWKASLEIHRDLLQMAPAHARACTWSYDAARAMLAVKTKPADQVKQIEALVATAAAMKGREDETALECRENAAAMSRELARAFHVDAATTKSAETLEYADRLYRVYVDSFPEQDDRIEVSNSYGELLWARADRETNAKLRTQLWERAADAFALGADDTDAAHAAILGVKNALDFDAAKIGGKIDLARSAKTKVVKAQTLPPRATKLIALATTAATALDPSDAELAQIQLIAIAQLRQYHHDDDAITALEHFLDDHHESAEAEIAATWLLDSLARTRQFDDLAEMIDLLATDTKFISTKPNLVNQLAVLRKRR